MSEESFLTPFNRCDDRMVRVITQLNSLGDALRYTGNPSLAGKLDGLVNMLKDGREELERGRSIALMTYVGSTERATINMVNAAIAAVSK